MILDEIVMVNQLDLAFRKNRVSISNLEDVIAAQPPPLDFASALKGDDIKLIAEVKKASPSKGIICANFDPVRIAQIYSDNGAAAISVLTETSYFKGSLDYLKDIRAAVGNKTPLLRKDFIYDPYQIYESRAYGADALLLIVSILVIDQLRVLLRLSHELGMQCLVEVHNEAEVEIALASGAGIIGINNRDLTTFNVDLETTGRLRKLIPADRIMVSESGIKNKHDIEKMRQWKINAVLVGETLMTAPDIAVTMKELL